MNTTKSTMIPIRSIDIHQAEGLTASLVRGTWDTWEAANGALRRIMIGAPTNGGYHKTDVTITWADGHQVKSREDVSNDGVYKPDLAANIRNTWLFYSGLKKPDHLTEEEYDRLTADEACRNTAVEYLKKYDLHDSVVVISKALPDVPPITWADYNDAIERVARLLTRVESPEMKKIMTAAEIRTASMDTRRALASLVRVRDMTFRDTPDDG